MNEGRKPLTGAQQDAAWRLARKHQLMILEQGTQAFDEALFAFCADVLDLLLNDTAAAEGAAKEE